jgi:hypothetical protein
MKILLKTLGHFTLSPLQKGRIAKLFKYIPPLYPLWNFLLTRFEHFLVDIYILSFPKSGRTWLRVLLTKLFNLKFKTPLDLELFRITSVHPNLPTIQFAHHPFREDRMLTQGKVLYVRNNRDI